MLRAYSQMPADEFIAQLRVYVIALGLGPNVISCVDNLTGIGELEDAHSIEVTEAEEQSEKRGRENMKTEMINAVTYWLENQQFYQAISEPMKDVLKLLEEVEA